MKKHRYYIVTFKHSKTKHKELITFFSVADFFCILRYFLENLRATKGKITITIQTTKD